MVYGLAAVDSPKTATRATRGISRRASVTLSLLEIDAEEEERPMGGVCSCTICGNVTRAASALANLAKQLSVKTRCSVRALRLDESGFKDPWRTMSMEV